MKNLSRLSCRLDLLEPRRLFAFGDTDTAFGIGGRAVTQFSTGSFTANAQNLHVVSAGKILAAGPTGLTQYAADGSLDTAFGTDGKVVFSGLTYKAVTVDSSGKIYVLVTASSGSVVVRYTAGGDPDASFASNGTALVSSSPNFSPSAIAIQSDGKILVGGTAKTDAGSGAKVRIYRLKTDGLGDNTFDGDAAMELNFGATSFLAPVIRDKVVAIRQLSGGKIMVAGGGLNWAPSYTDPESGNHVAEVYDKAVFGAARINSNGTLDSSFGSSGVIRSEYAKSSAIGLTGISVILPSAAAIDADGSVYVAAQDGPYSTSKPVAAKFDSAGTDVDWQTSPGSGAALYHPTDLAILEDGRVAIVGTSRNDSTNSGIPFTTIDSDGKFRNIVLAKDDDDTTPDPDVYYSTSPAIAQADGGELLVGGAGGAGYGSDSYVVGQFDAGSVSDARPDEFLNARANDIVRDGEGGLHLAYYDAAAKVLKYAYRAPNGVWNSAITIDNKPNAGQYVSIDVSSKNLPGIAYFDGTNGDLKLTVFNGSKWTYYSVETKGSTGLYPSLQFDDSDRPTMTYYKKTGGDLRFAVMQSPGVFGFETVDSTGDVGRSNVLVASPKTRRYTVAYAATDTAEVKWAGHQKGGKWTVKSVAQTAIGADFISMAYGYSYEPAITYYDAKNGDLKLAYFTASSQTFTVKALATAGAQGLYSQVFFPSYYGQPAVYQFNRSQNKIVLLSDLIDTSISTAGSIEGVGKYLSVAYDNNGLPTDLVYFNEPGNVIQVRPALRVEY